MKRLLKKELHFESDIKVMTNTIQELDAKKQEAIANLNALHGAKQQCESFLKELDNDDQTASTVLLVRDVGKYPQ